MAKSVLSADSVCKSVTEKCREAATICQNRASKLKEVQKQYEALIKKKKGKMDLPTITVENCSSGKGGVVQTDWTKLWSSGGKFYKG